MSKSNRNKPADYSLYLVTDRDLSLGRSHHEVVAAAVEGGVSCVQLREKKLDTRDFVEEARRLKRLLEDYGVPLIINDRIDVALAAGADGVHLGQKDMLVADARRLLGENAIIGVSAESVEDAVRAEKEGADYIAISPVYATATKPDTAAPLGPSGIGAIRKVVRLPLIGIGGIDDANIADVVAAGADGIAVISAIVAAPSPKEAALLLRRRMERTQQG